MLDTKFISTVCKDVWISLTFPETRYNVNLNIFCRRDSGDRRKRRSSRSPVESRRRSRDRSGYLLNFFLIDPRDPGTNHSDSGTKLMGPGTNPRDQM